MEKCWKDGGASRFGFLFLINLWGGHAAGGVDMEELGGEQDWGTSCEILKGPKNYVLKILQTVFLFNVLWGTHISITII